MKDEKDWWDELLESRRMDGAMDAEKGVFEPPWTDAMILQTVCENFAYEKGWNQRRKEFGDGFKWR